MNTRSLLSLVVLAFASLTPLAEAQNLFANPGFETGDLTGWTSTNGVTVNNNAANHTEGMFGAVLSSASLGGIPANLSQAVITTASHRYLFAFDYLPGGAGSQSVQVFGTSSSTIQPLSPDGSGKFQHALLSFTADSASTTLAMSVSATAGAAQMAVDNFLATEAKFSKPGKYTGSLRVTTSFADRNLSSFHLETLAARIDANGQLSLISQPGGAPAEGVLTDSKFVFLGGSRGTATFAGPIVKFTFEKTLAPNTPGNPTSAPVTITSSYTLRRVGN